MSASVSAHACSVTLEIISSEKSFCSLLVSESARGDDTGSELKKALIKQVVQACLS